MFAKLFKKKAVNHEVEELKAEVKELKMMIEVLKANQHVLDVDLNNVVNGVNGGFQNFNNELNNVYLAMNQLAQEKEAIEHKNPIGFHA